MDQEREREHLAQANKHIAEAEVRIAELKDRISLQQKQGYNTALSAHTLRLFERTFRLMKDHHERILQELGDAEPQAC